MSDTTRTVDEMIGDLHRKIEGLKAQMVAFCEPHKQEYKQKTDAYCEPIKEQCKEMERQIKRLLLEDGRQIVDGTLFAPEGEG